MISLGNFSGCDTAYGVVYFRTGHLCDMTNPTTSPTGSDSPRDSNKSISLCHFCFEEDTLEEITAKGLVPLIDIAGSPTDIVEIPGRFLINS